RCLLVRAIRYS
ncbi:fibronectin type III domain-containing protein, partial [Escherichia coli FRIK1997]